MTDYQSQNAPKIYSGKVYNEIKATLVVSSFIDTDRLSVPSRQSKKTAAHSVPVPVEIRGSRAI